MNLNQWVVDNASLVGFINITLTILLTALNVWFAHNSQRYSRETIKQNERVRKENNTPNITAHFESKNGMYYFHVNNFGVNAAKDVRIEYTPLNEIKELKYLNHSSLVNSTIKFLAPGQNINTFIGSYQEIVSSNNLPILEIKIIFFDIDSNNYERNYVLDMNVFKGNLYTIEKTMTDLTKEIKEVDKTLGNVEVLFHNYIKEVKSSNRSKRRFRG